LTLALAVSALMLCAAGLAAAKHADPCHGPKCIKGGTVSAPKHPHPQCKGPNCGP